MQTKWLLDPTHSEMNFKVRHMMISNVKGNFTDFSAEIETEDESFSTAKTTATINVASISTNNEDRDNHLKSADFLNVEAFPQIKFSTNAMNDDIKGELTIGNVTKEVKLEVDFGGIKKDPWGQMRAGFSFEGKIKRSDFGLNWNVALEAGGVLVGDEIKISGDLEFLKAGE